MKFGHFFVDRPIFAAVVSIVIVIVGVIAYTRLPITEYPDIAPPSVSVVTTYPGADAETLARTVATPIEQEINGVEGMLYMSSYSTSDGTLQLTVVFRPGVDLDIAQVQVQNRVAVAEARLPEEVRRQGIQVRKRSGDFLLVVHLLSPDKSYDELYLANYMQLRIREQLLRLDGAGDVIVFGGSEYSIRIWLDPARLAAYSLTSGEVVAALRAQNVQVSGGQLGQQPAPTDTALQAIVTTQGRFQDVRQFRNVIVKAGEDGRLVRLQDIARVEMGAKDYGSRSYLDSQVAIALGVFQRPGTNALATAEQVKAKMDELQRDFPPGLKYDIIYNPTEFIVQSIDAVYETLIEAILLVALVVLIFLQNWRAALIPILAIPVSLIGTAAFMLAFGFTLNVLTLFGMVLAIGIVVDDAIVVVENIERNIAEGLSPREAAHRTMGEVGTAVVAIAVVLAAVFVPTAFIPGISGQFYRQFALTIAVSTIISAFNSLSLSAALGAILLKPHRSGEHQRSRFLPIWIGQVVARKFNTGFDRTSHAYAGGVRSIIRHRAMSLIAYAVLVGATVYMFGHVPQGFIPPLDRGYAIVIAQLPDGATLDRTDAVVKKAEKFIEQTPGVAHIVSIPGFNGATFTNSPNAAVVFVTFKPFEDRLPQGLTSDRIIGDMIGRLQGIEEAFVLAVPPPAVPSIGNSGGFKMQLQNRTSDDIGPLLMAAYQMMGRARTVPTVTDVFTTFSVSSPQVYLNIDRVKAQMLNVPLSSVFEALQVNIGSAYVNDFNAFGRVFQVRIQADAKYRLERADIQQLKVRSATGELVPLGTLLDVVDASGPDLVQRYNMYVSVPIQGNTPPGISTGASLDAMEKLARESLQPGQSFEWTELALQERSVGNTAVFIFALSILFVFLALSAQYESWTLPLAIMLIVPMSMLFGLIGVWVAGIDNNVLVQIGLVVLIGLAAKNAILIVEFARQQEHAGLDPIAAVIEACRLRLRPILMTAFAFILGVLPLVTSSGAGAEMRRALGTTVFAGMIGVTLIGLFLTPVFYVSIRFLEERLRRRPAPAPQAPAE
ncbi:efflux RND transporter permease subunit [Reyranella sp. CPCC 100927]|uniref:efflux RND transporter permease subunit n=1 Tax=Reyranella sp. CPCC 100927 TaxID=2599616 RepID=UPI0011B358A5|nr:multidrug efflux RND transporter permease subunit [Reyranella sp. CPCC 100927]TWT03079.1 multidrug efflux RND transporter permease subunit [Reyranella sp. CPCC 100927]